MCLLYARVVDHHHRGRPMCLSYVRCRSSLRLQKAGVHTGSPLHRCDENVQRYSPYPPLYQHHQLSPARNSLSFRERVRVRGICPLRRAFPVLGNGASIGSADFSRHKYKMHAKARAPRKPHWKHQLLLAKDKRMHTKVCAPRWATSRSPLRGCWEITRKLHAEACTPSGNRSVPTGSAVFRRQRKCTLKSAFPVYAR